MGRQRNGADKAETAAKEAAPKVTVEELREKARTEYGIVNADAMSEKQLKAEIKAIDNQAK
jgi:co-chaperonin GroES (HSP10)